ncbi:uncharacterized protein LOC131676411 [Topomyia yanbarensis]|uniref:uncharacterized protein LOC131676411 n=1 Tax=Topomyia yanbarensis TaxID=2498891 RepID=UPI00273B1E9E|nr:uncharacterized protein LOC131676411 [Topomyia yanbarensis]
MRLLREVSTSYDPRSRTWSGPRTPPVFNPVQSLGELILRVLNLNSEKVVQIGADSGTQVTGAELCLRTIRIAQNLLRAGFVGGVDKDVIFSMAVRNGEHTAPVLFACFALGIPVNTLDPTFQKDDFAHMLGAVRPKLVFCDGETLEEMVAACKMSNISPRIIVMGNKVEGFDHVEDLLVATGDENSFFPAHFENPSNQIAVLVCSSGTTGRSKAVSLSHSICIAHVVNFFDCKPDDRVFAFSSLYWLSGLVMLLAGTVRGATRIITRRPFSATLAMEIVERFHVTAAFFPPSQVSAIVTDSTSNEKKFRVVRLAFSGGGPVSGLLKRRFDQLIPGRSLEVAYGLSEIAYAVTFTAGDSYRDGTVGFLKPGVEIKIIDDNGEPLEIDQEGEIVVRAKNVFLGYYGNEEATAEMLDHEGWLHTGDLGRFDQDGLLYVVDRKKDIIKFGNYQISPSEIESVVQSVTGVTAVCVVGIPAEGNDLPAALIVRADSKCTSDVVLREVEEKLPNYKHLRGGVYFTKELPMTPSGKVLRREAKAVVLRLRNE